MPHEQVAARGHFTCTSPVFFRQHLSAGNLLFSTTQESSVLLLIWKVPQSKNKSFILILESAQGRSY